MTGKAAKAYVTACLLVFAVSLCLLVYQGRKGVQAEEASDLSAETAAGQGNYLQYDASLEENTLPVSYTHLDVYKRQHISGKLIIGISRERRSQRQSF